MKRIDLYENSNLWHKVNGTIYNNIHYQVEMLVFGLVEGVIWNAVATQVYRNVGDAVYSVVTRNVHPS